MLVIIALGIRGGIGGKVGEKKDRKAEYRWPASELASLIPQPESKNGKVQSENERYFSIDIYGADSEQFEDYIDRCKESGFTEEYSRLDGYYHAENADGFNLSLNYDEKEKEMGITLNVPVEESSETQEKATEKQETETAESSEAQVGETEKSSSEENYLVDGMRPEFKEAMDSYEAFYDEYCDFMKKYDENSSNLEFMAKYADMLKKLADMDEKFAAWEDDDLNDAELKYYAEVNVRILQKLAEVSAD